MHQNAYRGVADRNVTSKRCAKRSAPLRLNMWWRKVTATTNGVVRALLTCCACALIFRG